MTTKTDSTKIYHLDDVILQECIAGSAPGIWVKTEYFTTV